MDNQKLNAYVKSKKTAIIDNLSKKENDIAYVQHNIDSIKFLAEHEALASDHKKLIERLNTISNTEIEYTKDIHKVLKSNGIRTASNYVDDFFSIIVNSIASGMYISVLYIMISIGYYVYFDVVATMGTIYYTIACAMITSLILTTLSHYFGDES